MQRSRVYDQHKADAFRRISIFCYFNHPLVYTLYFARPYTDADRPRSGSPMFEQVMTGIGVLLRLVRMRRVLRRVHWHQPRRTECIFVLDPTVGLKNYCSKATTILTCHGPLPSGMSSSARSGHDQSDLNLIHDCLSEYYCRSYN